MKKYTVVFIGFILFFSFINVSCGQLITFERALSPFERVSSDGNVEIRFHISREYRAVVTVNSNLIEYLELNITNNTLNVGTKNGLVTWLPFTKYIVDIYCPGLSGISISGSGNFTNIDTIITQSFESNISGSGKVEGTIECDKYIAIISGSGDIINNIICKDLSADISGSGNIKITGTGINSDIKISGSGNFDGIEYKTDNATARISGSGDMNIWVMENLTANVSGSGSIKYRGNPKINFYGSGSERTGSL